MDLTPFALFAVACAVGVFNIVVGPTGGVMAGATAALVAPPASLLLHAAVSWWSSLWRCVVLRDRIPWYLVVRLAAGSIPALVVVLIIGTRVNADIWRLVIAAYLVTWALSVRVRTLIAHPRSHTAAALAAGAASAAIGAGGVLVMPTIRSACGSLDEAIATEAALTVVQNTVKTAVLVLVLGVSMRSHGSGLVAMVLGASTGLALGRRLALTLAERARERLLAVTLLGVAGWLVVSVLI